VSSLTSALRRVKYSNFPSSVDGRRRLRLFLLHPLMADDDHDMSTCRDEIGVAELG